MRYENVNCAACGKTFTESDDVVVCPICGTPHHRACWMETGRCANTELHAAGYAWEFPAEELRRREAAARDAATPKPEVRDDIKLKNGENVVICPNCGAANYENDIYCLRCGARLKPATDEETYRAPDEDEDDVNFGAIRSDFDRYGGISPDALVDGIPCREYSAFVGGSKPGRIIRKVSTMERYGRKLSWTWAALIFGPIWFFWRKMKKEGAILSIFVIFFAALLAAVQLDDASVDYIKKDLSLLQQAASGQITLEEFQDKNRQYAEEYAAAETESLTPARSMLVNGLEYCLFFGIPLLSAAMAMSAYRKKVREDVAEIRKKCSSMEEYYACLQTEGGTSTALAAVGVILMLVAAFCALYLPFVIVAVFMQ